jgi:hypothetical protein
MNIRAVLHGLRALALSLISGLLICAPTHAVAAEHFGGVGHFGGGYGFHGGYGGYGGYRGGYGWRGGWGWGGGYGWGWGWPGYGLFLSTLPFYYSTVWWNGVPYYYADDTYYVWNGPAGAYQSVPPPGVAPPAGQVANPAASAPGGPAPGGNDLFAYPKNGQTADQQARDREECRNWAASQTGAGPGALNRGDNLRAQTACLEARGYSVK